VRLAKAHLKSSRGKVSAILVNAATPTAPTRTGMKVALGQLPCRARALKTPIDRVIPASHRSNRRRTGLQVILTAVPGTGRGPGPVALRCRFPRHHDTDRIPKVAFGEVPLNRRLVRIAAWRRAPA